MIRLMNLSLFSLSNLNTVIETKKIKITEATVSETNPFLIIESMYDTSNSIDFRGSPAFLVSGLLLIKSKKV